MSEGKKIYIVDDDPIHRLLMNKLFARQPMPYQLEFFENGQKAIDALQSAINGEADKSIPDLILLDIEMPILNGWQFMDNYQSLDEAVKENIDLYMVSSSFSDEDQERVKHYPDVKNYIVKPIRLERIIELLG